MTLFLISWYTLVVVLVVFVTIFAVSEIQSIHYKYISKQEYIKKKEEANKKINDRE